jgi:deoxyribonuclease-4
VQAERFKALRDELGQAPYAVHVKYLVNLGTNKQPTREKSLAALQQELDAAGAYGAEYVVFHPGAYTGDTTREQGIENISSGIDAMNIPEGVTLLLENTSGKGTTLGTTLEELDELIRATAYGYGRLGVCFDTCHAFCAGFPIHAAEGLSDTMHAIGDIIGFDNLKLIHLNDSKHPFESNKDEHAHIGRGHIGAEGFRRIVTEPRLSEVPFVLETPVEEGYGYAENIATVREMLR